MKTMLFIIMSVFFCLHVNADTKKADRLFEHWEYFRAAKLYSIEASKHPCADLYFKLGECYRKMNLCKEQQAAYDNVNAYGIYSKPEFYLNYGQVLKSNGWDDQARLAFDRYTQLMPSDTSGKFFSESIFIVADDRKWDEPISITNVALLNTPYADLCPVNYKGGVVFTSNRKAPGRTKIYGWTGANYLDLYFAQKGLGDLDYTNISAFVGNSIVNRFNDGPACFSKNFDSIYISRVDRDLKGREKAIFKIERNKIFLSVISNGKWTESIPFFLNNDTYSVANPFLTTDGSRLYFVSDMPGGYGETDIYYCNREGDRWGNPVNMGPNVNTFLREKYPMVDSNGNFYFSSDGYQGFGGLDICVALNIGGVLAKAIPLKCPINSSADDFGLMFLREGKAGYFSSNRYATGLGDDDIYYFNFQKDAVDTDLLTTVYTIGYRPKERQTEFSPDPIPTVCINYPADVVIYFDFDRDQIRLDAVSSLDSVARFMIEFPSFALNITGHCDCRGTSKYNLELAIRRSKAAFRYLERKGVSADRMSSEGYGTNASPINCEQGVYYTSLQYQQDRRAFIHFLNVDNQKSNEIILNGSDD